MKVALPLKALGLVLVFAFSGVQSPSGSAEGDPIIVAAGDIACDPADPSVNGGARSANTSRVKVTPDLVARLNPLAGLPLAGNQYDDGTLPKPPQAHEPAS